MEFGKIGLLNKIEQVYLFLERRKQTQFIILFYYFDFNFNDVQIYRLLSYKILGSQLIFDCMYF